MKIEINNWEYEDDVHEQQFYFSSKLNDDIIGCIVTPHKGNGYENTKHYEYFPNFEQAFNFVDEFSKQKFFDQVVEKYFKGYFK